MTEAWDRESWPDRILPERGGQSNERAKSQRLMCIYDYGMMYVQARLSSWL